MIEVTYHRGGVMIKLGHLPNLVMFSRSGAIGAADEAPGNRAGKTQEFFFLNKCLVVFRLGYALSSWLYLISFFNVVHLIFLFVFWNYHYLFLIGNDIVGKLIIYI